VDGWIEDVGMEINKAAPLMLKNGGGRHATVRLEPSSITSLRSAQQSGLP
jgi:hypothetical protein